MVKWFQPIERLKTSLLRVLLKTFGWLRSKLLGKDLRPLLFGDAPLTEDELQQEPGLDDKGCSVLVCWVGIWGVFWGTLRWDSW